MNPQTFQYLIQIAEYYGYETQKKQAIEELAELIIALATGDEENLAEEMADVEIMLTQLRILKIDTNKVVKYRKEKIERQIQRINREKEMNGND